MIDHDLHQFLEGSGVGVPAEFGAGLRGIAPEVDDVGGAVEVGGDLHEGLADEVVGAADTEPFSCSASPSHWSSMPT